MLGHRHPQVGRERANLGVDAYALDLQTAQVRQMKASNSVFDAFGLAA
jgi:hypothetical protein